MIPCERCECDATCHLVPRVPQQGLSRSEWVGRTLTSRVCLCDDHATFYDRDNWMEWHDWVMEHMGANA